MPLEAVLVVAGPCSMAVRERLLCLAEDYKTFLTVQNSKINRDKQFNYKNGYETTPSFGTLFFKEHILIILSTCSVR